jgi:hypothetical protein
MTSDIEAIFERVNCAGTLCVQRLDGSAEGRLDPRRPARC